MLILLCAPAFPVSAMEHEDIVERAITAMDNDFKGSWAFTEVSVRDGSVFVASYDPRRSGDSQWQLDSVDEREPFIDEIESFLSGKAARKNDDSEDDQGIEAHIQPDTLNLLEETSEHWLFSFVPAEDDSGKEFMQHIDGKMKIVKDGHYIEYFDLRSEKPFKPALGIKVKTFNSRLTFGPATEEGPIVPRSVDLHVEGRAYLAVKFDETEKIRYSDYQQVGAE